MTYRPTDKIGSLTEREIDEFLSEPWNGRIATIAPEGWPYVTPVWYEFDPRERVFYVVGRERADWVVHVRHDPRVAFHVADDMHREHTRVLVQARAEIVEGPLAPSASARIGRLTRALSVRYLGPKGPQYAEKTFDRPRVLVKLVPERWRSWTGGEWQARYLGSGGPEMAPTPPTLGSGPGNPGRSSTR